MYIYRASERKKDVINIVNQRINVCELRIWRATLPSRPSRTVRYNRTYYPIYHVQTYSHDEPDLDSIHFINEQHYQSKGKKETLTNLFPRGGGLRLPELEGDADPEMDGEGRTRLGFAIGDRSSKSESLFYKLKPQRIKK